MFIAYRLTLTRVVFKFFLFINLNIDIPSLTLTRVVFKFESSF